MIEIVQDVILTDVAGPLLNGVWGFLESFFQRQAGFADGDTIAVHSTWMPFWEVKLKGFLAKSS